MCGGGVVIVCVCGVWGGCSHSVCVWGGAVIVCVCGGGAVIVCVSVWGMQS